MANFLILGWLMSQLHERWAITGCGLSVVFSVAVFLFYAFFDLLPKMLFRLYPNRLCVSLARPFRLLIWLLRPLVALVEAFSAVAAAVARRQGLHRAPLRQPRGTAAGDAGVRRRRFTSEERAMINRVLDLQTLTVRQVMKPLEQAVAITAQTPVSAALALCRERQLTRLPVWETRDGRQRIVGLLALNTLLYQPALDAEQARGRIREAGALPG